MSGLEVEWRVHGSALTEAFCYPFLASSWRVVGNSVENHLLQSWVREFYAGAPFAGVIWTL
jgi:hypothetical protein